MAVRPCRGPPPTHHPTRLYETVTSPWLRCRRVGAFHLAMSYTLTLSCGCTVYVACHPRTRVAHSRVIEFRGPSCRVRRHDVGVRLFLWEMLPERDELSRSPEHLGSV